MGKRKKNRQGWKKKGKKTREQEKEREKNKRKRRREREERWREDGGRGEQGRDRLFVCLMTKHHE